MGRMIPFLAKRWFLLVLLVGILTAWLWPVGLGWTRLVPPKLVMSLALFLSAWTLVRARLYAACRSPWPALWAAAISYLLLPALGWLTGGLAPLADFRIGLMICACVPCTLASAVLWTRMAGGDEATALLSTFISTALGWLATSSWLTWTTGSQIQLDTLSMMRELALILLLPVVVGQLARAPAPLRWTATRFRASIGVVSRMLILVIMLRTALEVLGQLEHALARLGVGLLLFMAVLCVGNHLAALYFGWWSSARLGFSREAAIAVAFSGSQKTLPVSLVLWESYFRDYPLAVAPLLFYHAGQLIVDTVIADQWSAAGPREDKVGSDRTAAASGNEATAPSAEDGR